MPRLAAEHDALRVIDNQFGVSTGVELIADVTAHAIRATVTNPDFAGTYHLAAGARPAGMATRDS